MATIEVWVDGVRITNAFRVSGQVALSTQTAASFTLLADDAQVSDVAVDLPAEVRIVGASASKSTWWVVTAVEDTIVSDGEEAAEVIEVTLTSAESLLGQGVVYPSAGVDDINTPIFVGRAVRKPVTFERYPGPGEPSFDDSGWSAATSPGPIMGPYAPSGWCTPSAVWIGGTVDLLHFRKTFSVSGAFALSIDVAFSNDGELWLDDVLLLKLAAGVDDGISTQTRRVTVQINDGSHTFYGWVQRIGVVDCLLGVAAYKQHTTTLVCKSDTSWKMTSSVPTITPGLVVGDLIGEAKVRGALPAVSATFDDTLDTKGVEWPAVVGQWPMRVGEDTVQTVLDAFCDGYVEYNMSCATDFGDLDVWVGDGVDDADGNPADGAGQVVGVSIAKGVNALDVRRLVAANIQNAGLVMFDGGILEVEITGSTSVWGRREVGLSLGRCDGPAALNVAAANLLPASEPSTSVEADVLPAGDADTPLVGFGLGDWVTVATRGGTSSERCLAVNFALSDLGELELRPEFSTLREVVAQRHQRAISRTNGGTLDGRSRTARPSSPSIDRVEVRQPFEVTFSTDGSYEVQVTDLTAPVAMDMRRGLVALWVECEAAGAGDSTFELFKNGAGTGRDVTVAASTVEWNAWFDLSTVWEIGDTYQLRCTDAGGHEGVSVRAVWANLGG